MAVVEAELSWGFFGWQSLVEDLKNAEAERAKEQELLKIAKVMRQPKSKFMTGPAQSCIFASENINSYYHARQTTH